MKNWRRLSLEFYICLFGWRVEIDVVPFQWAAPQFAYGPSLAKDTRKPSAKFGPLHIWTMTGMDKWEIGFSADTRAAFHKHKFSAVYPNTFVWPLYTKKETSE